MGDLKTALKQAFDEELQDYPTSAGPEKSHATRTRDSSLSRRRDLIPGLAAVVLVVAIVASLLSARYLSAAKTPRPIPAASPKAATTRHVDSVIPLSATSAWITFNDTLFRTADGGASWHPVLSGVGRLGLATSLSPGAIWVTSQASGSLTVWRTSDGGRTWSRGQVSMPGQIVPIHMQFVDELHGWLLVSTGSAAGSEGVVLWSTFDGGASWQMRGQAGQGSATGSIPFGCQKTGFTFVTPSDGWLVGECYGGPAFIYSTHDSGSSWTRQSLHDPSSKSGAFLSGDVQVAEPAFFGSSTGILIVGPVSNPSGVVSMIFYRTSDGGRSWAFGGAGPNGSTLAAVATPSAWVALSQGALYSTQDAGSTWSAISRQPLTQALSIVFVSPTTGWAIQATNDGHILLKTEDGGATWTPQPA